MHLLFLILTLLLVDLLVLKGTTKHPAESFLDFRKKYGEKLYTFWIGNYPVVFIFDYDLAKEAFNKGVFAGRPQTFLSKILTGKGNYDVVLSDFTPEWETLRKVAHSAVRKYAISERLPVLTSDVVDEIMHIIMTKEGDKPFNPKNYVDTILNNTLASIAFGKR
jgi:Cytochrome P450